VLPGSVFVMRGDPSTWPAVSAEQPKVAENASVYGQSKPNAEQAASARSRRASRSGTHVEPLALGAEAVTPGHCCGVLARHVVSDEREGDRQF